jgi:hypothetical protein
MKTAPQGQKAQAIAGVLIAARQVLRHPKTRSPLGIKIKGKHPEGLGFGCEASGYLARAGKVPLRFEDMPQPLKPMLVSVALRHD